MGIANITLHLKNLADADEATRKDLVEAINVQNYGLNILSEHDMWILRTAAENADFLSKKLKEADELSLDDEAPSEDDELSLDDAGASDSSEDEAFSMDDSGSAEEGGDELSLDDAGASDSSGDELSLDDAGASDSSGDELSLDDAGASDGGESSSEESGEKKEFETSLEGAGILPLIAQIQEKLANGKPSEVELAALKAMKKLF